MTSMVHATALAEAGTSPVTLPGGLLLRPGTPADAVAILRLIDENLEAGHLLPRTLEDIAAHAARFTVIANDATVVGCAELAPLSRAVAEVRSLVVDAAYRGRGLGTALIAHLERRARHGEFTTLCALTHEPGHFVRLGFSIVPHVWFPEKIALDCVGCARFRRCGQVAVALDLAGRALARPRESPARLPVVTGGGGPVATAPRARYLRTVTR